MHSLGITSSGTTCTNEFQLDLQYELLTLEFACACSRPWSFFWFKDDFFFVVVFFSWSVCVCSRDLSKDWAGKMLEAVKIDTCSQRKNRVDDTNAVSGAEWRTWHSSIVSERRSTVHYCWWQNWHKATAYSNERVNGCMGRSLEVKLGGWIRLIYSYLQLHFMQMQFLNCCLVVTVTGWLSRGIDSLYLHLCFHWGWF